MSTRYIIVLFVFTVSLNTFGLAQKAPATFLIHGEVLLKNKQAIINQEVEKLKALNNVQAKADQIVKEGKIYSVMNKKKVPPSGDKHDYMSQAPYGGQIPQNPTGFLTFAGTGSEILNIMISATPKKWIISSRILKY